MIIVTKRDLEHVDWEEMKATLQADEFDNGRSAEQLSRSFANSQATCIAYCDGRIVGTARALSDGVCNAYVVDVWTHSRFRQRGIGRAMMETLLRDLAGQHVYLFTDDSVGFYRRLGFEPQGVGLGRVAGRWLDGESEV